MKNLNRIVIVFIAMYAYFMPTMAQAGRSCEEKKVSPLTIERGLALAEKTQHALNASGEKVVLLARAGQDLSKYGLQYSHLGLAYQLPNGQGGYTWRVIHKLNDCGTSTSAIYSQGLGEFFLDDLWRFDAAWVAPTPEVQTKLLQLIQDPAQATSMHHKPYSMVSYAWARKYQQSNQWAIETLAAAVEPAILATGTESVQSLRVDAQRQRAQAWLQFKGYEPTTLKLGALTRLGGRITAANIAFDDHPNDKRYADRIETVTVDSVFQWMQRAQLTPSGKSVTVVKQ